MDNHQEINRFVEKGLFNEGLKRSKEQTLRKKKFQAVCLVAISSISIAFFVFFLISSTPAPDAETPIPVAQPQKITKSILPTAIIGRPMRNDDMKAINILALGRPGEGYSGGHLTDTIIIMRLEPSDKSASLISLPRDLLVNIPGSDSRTKINALYSAIGIEKFKQKIQEISGLPIDHHIVVDLAVVKEIIDTVGGLNVYVLHDIDDPYFPGPNYSYDTFELESGWRYLDGTTALRYIRTRYTLPNGDFDRMARQQQIIHLLKHKVLSLNLLWDLPTYLKIFDSLQSHIDTDLSLLEIKSLWDITKDVDVNKITHLVVDKKKTGLLTGGLVPLGGQPASVVYPVAGVNDYSQIREYIKQFLE